MRRIEKVPYRMTFGDAMSLVEQGYKIGKYSWEEDRYIFKDENGIHMSTKNGVITDWSPHPDNMTACDWRVIK